MNMLSPTSPSMCARKTPGPEQLRNHGARSHAATAQSRRRRRPSPRECRDHDQKQKQHQRDDDTQCEKPIRLALERESQRRAPRVIIRASTRPHLFGPIATRRTRGVLETDRRFGNFACSRLENDPNVLGRSAQTCACRCDKSATQCGFGAYGGWTAAIFTGWDRWYVSCQPTIA